MKEGTHEKVEQTGHSYHRKFMGVKKWKRFHKMRQPGLSLMTMTNSKH